MIINKKDKLIN